MKQSFIGENSKMGGHIMSFYKCWHCDQKIELNVEPIERVFCERCEQEHRENYKSIVKDYTKLKTIIMYETALRIMEKCGTYMHDYFEAAKMVFKKIMKEEIKLFSSHEVITAIILENLLYEYYPNYPIDKYRVDFYVPELKSCVEIDGHLHKGKELYDSNRDIDIRNILGSDWEVVRIPTKYIEKNPSRIVDAVIIIHEKKQKLREENHGIIPDNFSMREKKHYESILGYKTKRVKKY